MKNQRGLMGSPVPWEREADLQERRRAAARPAGKPLRRLALWAGAAFVILAGAQMLEGLQPAEDQPAGAGGAEDGRLDLAVRLRGETLLVESNEAVTYRDCKIDLNDRWSLPQPTTLDANQTREYPLFLFRDERGVTPPVGAGVGTIFVHCYSPSASASFGR